MRALSSYVSLIITLSMVTLASTAAFVSIREYYNKALHNVYNGVYDTIIVEKYSDNISVIIIGFVDEITISKISLMKNGSIILVVENTTLYEDQRVFIEFINATISEQGIVCNEHSSIIIMLKDPTIIVIINTDRGEYCIG
ncbi:hypothetical protein J4526_02670 [Desulfurococcaceae archaeon MEX13E-LK6-19]|nr:hypothetical protein J4526_02670 [Desulfurococcaceae archaeon MEX13E-LK6-19]